MCTPLQRQNRADPPPRSPFHAASAFLPQHHAFGAVLRSTKDPGQEPFTYKAGVGQVITGWDQGLLGMKLGEVRELLIPANEGYGTPCLSEPPAPPRSVAPRSHPPALRRSAIPRAQARLAFLRGASPQAARLTSRSRCSASSEIRIASQPRHARARS